MLHEWGNAQCIELSRVSVWERRECAVCGIVQNRNPRHDPNTDPTSLDIDPDLPPSEFAGSFQTNEWSYRWLDVISYGELDECDMVLVKRVLRE